MLIKNKRGKIVIKKKSEQAALQNNLGDKLRPTGKKMKKSEILHSKKSSPKAPPKKKAAPAKAPPKKKAAPAKAPLKKKLPQ